MFRSNERHQFAPSPMDYMKGRIEQARSSLMSPGDPSPERSLLSPFDGSAVTHKSPADLGENIDDLQDALECSEVAHEGTLLAPERLVLPLHKGDMWVDQSMFYRLYLITTQPLSILVIATIVFSISSAAQQILSRFNLYQATYKFPFPLSITCLQFLFCDMVLLLWSTLSHYLVRQLPDWKSRPSAMVSLQWNFADMKQLAPVSLTYVISCSAVMYCLEYVPLGIAAFLISPTILVQLLLTKYFHPDGSQSIYTASICSALMLGHALTAVAPSRSGVPGYNLPGIMSGIIASVAIPLHNSLLKKTLLSTEHSSIQILHYVLVSSVAMILPMLVISGEIFDIAANCYFLDEKGFWLMMLVLSLVGTLACFSQFLLLTITTPLTVVVMHLAKSSLLEIPLAAEMNRNSMTWYNHIGLILCIASVCGYLYLINHQRPKFGFYWNTYPN